MPQYSSWPLFASFLQSTGRFLNQAIAHWLGAADERVGYTYLLRVARLPHHLGRQNFSRRRERRP